MAPERVAVNEVISGFLGTFPGTGTGKCANKGKGVRNHPSFSPVCVSEFYSMGRISLVLFQSLSDFGLWL